MKKFTETLDKVENTVIAVLLALQLITVLSFTIARYTQLWRMPWGEEFSRYCMIWMIYIGIIVGARKGAHYAVSALDGFMPGWLKKVFYVLRILFTDAFCIFATYQASTLARKQISTGQLSPALQWPMWIIYLAIPIGLFFFAIEYTIHNIQVMRGLSKDEEDQL